MIMANIRVILDVGGIISMNLNDNGSSSSIYHMKFAVSTKSGW